MIKISFIQKENKFIALNTHDIVGYLLFAFPNDQAGKRNIEISTIFVEPEFRGQGIGTALLQKFLTFCCQKKVIWVSLWTSKDLESVGRFDIYKRLGFKELVYQKDYYSDGTGTRLFAINLHEK